MDDLEREEDASFVDNQLDPFQRLLLSYIQRVAEAYPSDELLQHEVKKLVALVKSSHQKS